MANTEIVPTADTQPVADSLLNFVAQAVSDPNIDVGKLEALLRMQREIVADDAKVQFNRALHAAQAEIPHVAKNGRVELGGGKGGYQFTTWQDMDKVLRPIMDRHGFTLTFDMASKDGGGAVITGTLQHVAGHSRTASVPLSLDAGAGRNNLQAMGSTFSYGRRYVAEALFNIVRRGADDDGRLGGMTFITEAQRDELLALMKETRTEEGRFLAVMCSDVHALEEVDAKDFTRLKNALLAKQMQIGKKP